MIEYSKLTIQVLPEPGQEHMSSLTACAYSDTHTRTYVCIHTQSSLLLLLCSSHATHTIPHVHKIGKSVQYTHSHTHNRISRDQRATPSQLCHTSSAIPPHASAGQEQEGTAHSEEQDTPPIHTYVQVCTWPTWVHCACVVFTDCCTHGRTRAHIRTHVHLNRYVHLSTSVHLH